MTRLIPAVAALMLSAAPVMAERVSVLVFDASGSMWNRVQGDLTRIEVARDVMGDYFASRDGAVPLSVIAYGHNRRGDCGDIEVIAPMGQTQPATLESRLRGLMPRGMTPLTDSLRMARSQIPPTAEAADIILVTDGLETCEGDPCALAAELAAEGIDIRAHVVGFGLTRLEVEALACITEQTGGMLFDTNSGAELADALKQVSAAPPPPEPVPEAAPEPPALLAQHFVFRDTGTGTPRGLMEWRAEGADGTILDLGTTEGTQQSLEGRSVEMPLGDWLIVAEGVEGRAEQQFTLTQCCGHHGVPFTGADMAASIPPLGQVQAGMGARLPFEITFPGVSNLGGTPYKIIATGPEGSLTRDQIVRDDLITNREPGLQGGATGSLSPGNYRMLIVVARSGGYDIKAERSFEAVENPVVRISAPDRALPGESIAVSFDGGYATYYEIGLVDENDTRIGSSKALYQGAGGGGGGPMTMDLKLPDREGTFDLVVRPSGHPKDRETILARRPITIGTAPVQDTLPAVPATFRLPAEAPKSDVTWDAVPLDPDMSPEAWAPTDKGPVISGTFEPGRWRVTAYAPGEVVLSAEVEIFPGQVNDFTLQVQGGGEEDHGALTLDGPWRVVAVPPRDAPAGAATGVMDMLRITLRTRADATGWDGTFTPTALMVGPQAPLDTAALDSATEDEGYLFVRFQLPAVSPEAFVISLAPYEDGYSGTMASGPNSLPVVVWPEALALPSLGALQDQLYGPEPDGDQHGSVSGADPVPVTQSMGCDEAICERVNLEHGLEAQVPRGWMMWQVEHVDGALTAQFTNGTDILMLMGATVWPPENGPCLPTAAGPLCYWSNTSAEAQIAAAFIAANLRLTRAEPGQGVTISLPTEPVRAGTGGFFPVVLTGPPGFQGKITMTRTDAPDSATVFSQDAAFLLTAQDQVLPVPEQPGRYEVRITDATGTSAATAVFDALAGDAREGGGSMAIEPDDGTRFVNRGPYLAGQVVLVQINRGQDKRGSDRVVVLAGGTHTVLPDQGVWLDDFRASVQMPDAPGRYLLAVFDTESTSFRALSEIEVAASPVPELRHYNPNPTVRRPYGVAPSGRMAMADRLAIVGPGGAVVAEASLYEVITGDMRIPEGTSGPHELHYLAGGQILAREKLDVGGPPPLVPSGGSTGPAELTMEGDLVPGGMVRVSVRGMIPPQATVGFIGADKPDRTILETGSRVTPDALEVDVKVPEKAGPWVLRLIDQNLIRVAEIVPGGAASMAPAATGSSTIIPIDLGTLSPDAFRALLRPDQP